MRRLDLVGSADHPSPHGLEMVPASHGNKDLNLFSPAGLVQRDVIAGGNSNVRIIPFGNRHRSAGACR